MHVTFFKWSEWRNWMCHAFLSISSVVSYKSKKNGLVSSFSNSLLIFYSLSFGYEKKREVTLLWAYGWQMPWWWKERSDNRNQQWRYKSKIIENELSLPAANHLQEFGFNDYLYNRLHLLNIILIIWQIIGISKKGNKNFFFN